MEVEPVAVGEGYVARLAVERGGRAVIVQPTWELLVDALAEHLRGMGR